MFPTGYNLTKGGKNFTELTIPKNLELNPVKEKRGRDFGYSHKSETKEMMKEYQQNIKRDLIFVEAKRKNLSIKILQSCKKRRIENLSQMKLSMPLEQYIFPVYKKDTNIIKNYAIKMKSLNNPKGYLIHTNDSIENKYNKLLDNLKTAYDMSKNCSDNPFGAMDHPQPLT